MCVCSLYIPKTKLLILLVNPKAALLSSMAQDHELGSLVSHVPSDKFRLQDTMDND